MNKLYIVAGFVLLGILSNASHVFAADVKTTDQNYFSVETKLMESTQNKKQKNFSVRVVPNDTRINAWKVRFFCDEKFAINIAGSSDNMCGDVADLTSSQINNFLFSTLKRKNDASLGEFSFKVKAYDANGRWLHTEEKIFRSK